MVSDRGIVYDIRRKFQILASHVFSAKLLSKIYFRLVMKQKLNLKDPKTFNEKIQWLKLYYCPYDDNVITCSDKLRIREYLMNKGLLSYQVPLIGHWDDVKDINWDSLPNKFAIKCNHGCAYNIICTDKQNFDIEKSKKKLSLWMKEDFGRFNLEYHYDKIKKEIICEEFLDGGEEGIVDYKVHCFNGEPKVILICSDRIINVVNYKYYDLNWDELDYCESNQSFKKPENFEKMIEISRIIARDFPFVRVDFYSIKNKLMIGELTFVPAGGLDNSITKLADEEMGKMLSLEGLK